MNILIIGCGYVGLVTAGSFAKMGYSVVCIDTNKEKISQLQKGLVPIYEPGLSEMIHEGLESNMLSFFESYPNMQEIDIAFLCVSTPQGEDGSCDTSFLFSAAKELGKHLSSHTVIVNKSTAPVGTTKKLERILEINKPKEATFKIASNPEFLKQGSAVFDCMKPDRIIIGVDDPETEKTLRLLYAPFMVSRDKLLCMDPKSAELTKYAANAMLSSRISLINELANIASQCGADIKSVRQGMCSDRRIGFPFLYPGLGYGGSCFPKDLRALIHMAEEENLSVPMLKAIEEVNHKQKQLAGSLLEKYFAKKGGLKDKTIALWGASFKPDTDDIREAPSITIIQELLKKGASLKIFDPAAMDNLRNYFPKEEKLLFCKSPIDAAEDADAICLITEWKQFRSIDFTKILAKKPLLILDGRNQYDKKELTLRGFDYIGVGTPGK